MTTLPQRYLPGHNARARLLRLDAAEIFKRLFFYERSLILSQAAWLTNLAPFEIKTTLPRLLWEDAMTAHALRERVFELHYPIRLMEVGDDAPLVALFDAALDAPNAAAFVLALARVFKPALLAAYQTYLAEADALTDGPILRALRLACEEKAAQISLLEAWATTLLAATPEDQALALAWVNGLANWLQGVGGLSTDRPVSPAQPPDLPQRRPFQMADPPARDPRFHRCHYYWPDVVDPNYPYGDGIRLQLRSAVSHLNEVWAVETAGLILHAFADDLGWDFIYDTARWTYDEARHTQMGYDRLRAWGFDPAEVPLGTYIFDSARGQSPVIRLGMLHYFETKNIGKKTKRAQAFAEYQDRMSQHDMEFDWADEAIHAHYGKRWHDALRERGSAGVPDVETIRTRCDELVAAEVARATDQERAEIHWIAAAMIAKAETMIG